MTVDKSDQRPVRKDPAPGAPFKPVQEKDVKTPVRDIYADVARKITPEK